VSKLLKAVVLSTALACLGASAVSTATGHSNAPAAAPVATITHKLASSKRHKHLHASCRARRKHPRKHRPRCHVLTRGLHRGPSQHGATPNHPQAHRRSSPLPANALHAKGAAHASEPTTTVNVGPAPAVTPIESVLATPCENTEVAPSTDNLEQVDAATLCLINQERARHGELPLSVNAQLAMAAQLHSDDMAQADYFAHVAPNGETPLDRVQAGGYIPNSRVGYTIGENIAWGTLYLATPSSIVAAWIASPEHLANILNASYRDTAIAIVPSAPPSLSEGQAGAIYTQEFGVVQG
jgi:uncharacterized protein YkwD